MARPHIQLVGGKWFLWRLADDEFLSLGHHALPLFQNYELLLNLTQQPLPSGTPFGLGHAHAVLERNFGPSSSVFDSYRSSFSFPLLLTIEKARRISLLLRCHDYRGTLHFPLYRITTGDPSLEERSRYHPPSPEDFEQNELDELIACLHDVMRAQAEALETGLVAPFFKAIKSDAVLYGYDGTKFFERGYDRWDEYQSAKRDYEERIGPKRARSSSDRVERLIDRVTEL